MFVCGVRVTCPHSDVTLVSKDGKKFPAHRLVLCAQSGYFKALLESSLWQEGQSNEVREDMSGMCSVLLWGWSWLRECSLWSLLLVLF